MFVGSWKSNGRCHSLPPQLCRDIDCLNRASSVTLEFVVPVKGHWPSSRFGVTLSTVGVLRIDCSDIKEKPSKSPPHPAKRKSMPTKTIINLVGILANAVR